MWENWGVIDITFAQRQAYTVREQRECELNTLKKRNRRRYFHDFHWSSCSLTAHKVMNGNSCKLGYVNISKTEIQH